MRIEYEIHQRMMVEGKKGYWTIKQDCYPKDEAEAMHSMNALKSAFPEVEYRVCKITLEIIGA